MQVDSRGVAQGETIHTDLCIVGAGPAGIALALEFAGTGVDVCLMESGGLEPEAETQALDRGELAGHPYYPLESARLRYLGGTSGHWTGLCRPLDPIDFESRAWLPRSGWPLTREMLDPYYQRALPLLEIEHRLQDTVGAKRRLPFPPDRLHSALMVFSPPTRFGSRYRQALQQARNVRLFLYANAMDVEREREAGRIRRVRFATFAGNRLDVVARQVVIAAGGIENPRLLLASDGVERAGLGNGHDLVGRYFMEHPHWDGAAHWLLGDDVAHLPLYDWPRPDEGYRGRALAVLAFPAEVLRRERLLGFSAEIQLTAPWQETAGWESAHALARGVRRGRWPDHFGEHVGNVMSDLGSVAEGVWAKARGTLGAGASYRLKVRVEQSPNPESRVTLVGERDALGMRRVRLTWRLDERDLDSAWRGLVLVAREVGAAGLGRVRMPEDDPAHHWADALRGGWHHMGTTRMAADPARGVVDADCRVHGIGNLYVAGSSVFPTSGWANPTLTIVALALRLADHLKERFARGGDA